MSVPKQHKKLLKFSQSFLKSFHYVLLIRVNKESDKVQKDNFNKSKALHTDFVNKTVDKAVELNKKGEGLIADFKLKEAIKLFTLAIEFDPTNVVYYCNRAAVFIELNRLVSALKDCKVAVKLDPGYSRAHSLMGIVFANRMDYQSARNFFEIAAQLNPNSNSEAHSLKIARQLADTQLQFNIL